MPTAYVHLPHQVTYRREAFIRGFARLGFSVNECQPARPLEPDEVAVVWNKTGRSKQTVDMAKIGRGALIVAENGYRGRDSDGRQAYAMALDGHCGSGRWFAPEGDDSRLKRLQIDFQPFRPGEGKKLLIAGQRGIGSEAMRSPPNWAETLPHRSNLRGYTCNIRPHPGLHKDAAEPLLEQLEGVHSLLVWSSNCATEALIAGYPVYYDAPTIVTAGAAWPLRQFPHESFTEEARQAAFQRLSWAQWFVSEIESGEAARVLLDVHLGKLKSCNQGFGK